MEKNLGGFSAPPPPFHIKSRILIARATPCPLCRLNSLASSDKQNSNAGRYTPTPHVGTGIPVAISPSSCHRREIRSAAKISAADASLSGCNGPASALAAPAAPLSSHRWSCLRDTTRIKSKKYVWVRALGHLVLRDFKEVGISCNSGPQSLLTGQPNSPHLLDRA